MDDATAALAGHSDKYQIPLSHFEHKYIQNCADGKELERIYKELIGGTIGSFPDLEKLAFDRIRAVKPNSHILRQDTAPLDRSALPDDERQQLNAFLNQMKEPTSTVNDHQSNGFDSAPIRSRTTVNKPATPVSSAPVIKTNDKTKRPVPRSYDEWGKLEKTLSREMNSDADDDADDDDDDNDEEKAIESPSATATQERSQRLRMAEQHRLNGNSSFKSNNFQQSIDSYTKSITLDSTNPVIYMNRALAHYRLKNYDASMTDCYQVLSRDPKHVKALFRRASCRLAKEQHDEARRDLDTLLSVEPTNTEAKNLLGTLPKSRGARIPITEDDGEDDQNVVHSRPIPSVPVKIPIVEVEEDDEDETENQAINASTPSMSIDIPQKVKHHPRPGIDSTEASPARFDQHFQHRDDLHHSQPSMQFQMSSLSDPADVSTDLMDDNNDDDMELGDEAAAGLMGNMSDDDGHISHSLNVSPTMDDDDNDSNDPPALVDHQISRTPPPYEANDSHMLNASNNTYNRNEFVGLPDKRNGYNDLGALTNLDSLPDSRDELSRDRITTRLNPFETDDDFDHPSSQQSASSNADHISKSNFGATIQSWLRDLLQLQSARRPSAQHERTWSRSSRPWSLDKIQRDIERFNRLSDFRNAVDAAKKMLKNGVLDYHNHADHIVSILILCAQCYSKVNEHVSAVQFATEALQYNRTDSSALLCRAAAFEKDNFLLFSYADYARIPTTDHSYTSARLACDKLSIALNAAEGDNWRDKLPNDENDDDRYLAYVTAKDKSFDENHAVWYRTRGNHLYLDACYVLAIRTYSLCIELEPGNLLAHLNRAACYLKMFEAEKCIDDCTRVLEVQPNNIRALYRKACAYKMLHNDALYISTLQNLLRLQPNNQTILAEYYTSRHEQIPRMMRRLRATASSSTPAADTSRPSSTTSTVEVSSLTFEQLEELRNQKAPLLSTNTPYQFTQQLNTLKADDTRSHCALMLRIAPKALFKLASSASPKLVEIMANACRTMVHAEKRYQQEHKSSILPFSYVRFCCNLLVELTTLPRLDSALLMIDPACRASLDDLIAYFSSISSTLNETDKLSRLRT